MKKKKLVSMVGVLLLVISVVTVMSGCPGIGSGIAYAGTYDGEGEDDSGLGSWEFTINASGNLTGWFQILSEEKSECSGTLKADGSFTGNGKTKLAKVPFTITGKIASDNKVTGNLMVQGLNIVSFSGKKK